ncbi:MAG: 1,4-alpha-glucan branching protein GlgB [Lachnospiraceae bacterium]|nr:1,4-alpha-glucan branching protein GlgB [Lachnospiraceae bacterium]
MGNLEATLYDMMDWGRMEGVVYAEEYKPFDYLGPQKTEEGILIQAFRPRATSLTVKLAKTNKEYPMVLESEEGFFATLIPRKTVPEYTLIEKTEDGEKEFHDPYSFGCQITPDQELRFSEGVDYKAYKILGAHPRTIRGVSGVHFAVWAPYAMRVSVVGDFCNWDGRVFQMHRLDGSGIFELFVPEAKVGDLYKFEIKAKGGLVYLKADPYATSSELRPGNASRVWDIDTFRWSDDTYMKARAKRDIKKEPVSIYEVHLGSFKKPVIEGVDEKDSFYNYRELAPMLADYVKKMNYTHIELMPIMEHPFDASWGYQVTGYFSVTARYGTPDDFAYFMNYMHSKNIGVILDWVPAHFPRDTFGLSAFDGTCLYEHLDERQGAHPHWGTLIFNYGRPEVIDFLVSSAMFWLEKYHADGIRMDAVASMLYLDYGKNDGEWVANMYGGNENLEAIELLKRINTEAKKRKDGALIIAEESTAWPLITGDVEEDGLGFDYKWNMGWMNDFLEYMRLDPLFRKGSHGQLTFSMVYAYSEKYMLVLSHDEVVHGKGSMIGKMPGEYDEKFANLRAAYGYMMTHPGKKLLFMGQDFAQFAEWNEEKSLEWELIDEYESHRNMQKYVSALNKFYKDNEALYSLDHSPEGFEWISELDADHSIIAFLRKTKKEEESLLVVINFTPVVYKDFAVGVPFAGKYKEIFNSDSVDFGGWGNVNARVKQSKEIECDGREHSISITVPPLAMSVFKCTPLKKTAVKTTKTKASAVAKPTAAVAKATAAKKTTKAKTTTAVANATAANATATVANATVAKKTTKAKPTAAVANATAAKKTTKTKTTATKAVATKTTATATKGATKAKTSAVANATAAVANATAAVANATAAKPKATKKAAKK